jgi:phage/plasmid primase-like uncharacterized protein
VENEKLREQLQSFITQYEAREKHFEAQVQAKEAEKLAAEEKQTQVRIYSSSGGHPKLDLPKCRLRIAAERQFVRLKFSGIKRKSTLQR